MQPSDFIINYIKSKERYCGKPYIDNAGYATIGYGTRFYPNDHEVTINDNNITQVKATEYLIFFVNQCGDVLNKLIYVKLTQYQFDALCSLVYNVGSGNIQKSSLIGLINNNPNDKSIRGAILSFNKYRDPSTGGLKISKGLNDRRIEEIDIYFNQYEVQS